MNLHNNNIYITSQDETPISEIITPLLNVISDEINWVKWDKEGGCLTFSCEMPVKGYGGFKQEIKLFNGLVKGESFMYKILRPKFCSKDTPVGSIVFDTVNSKRGLYMTVGANGKFYASFDNVLRECDELWEEVKG